MMSSNDERRERGRVIVAMHGDGEVNAVAAADMIADVIHYVCDRGDPEISPWGLLERAHLTYVGDAEDDEPLEPLD